MALPQLMFKMWDGDDNERFTFRDMNRLTYNANIIAREANVTEAQFIEADRSQQFRYDEVQKLENLTDAIALTVGLVVGTERNWMPMRSVSYKDFERIESNLYAVYKRLGGIGDRIADNKRLVTVSATLFPNAWTGSPPHIDLTVPFVHAGRDVMAFVPHTATLEQRTVEHKARLSAAITADRTLRITANGMLPRVQLPIKITIGGMNTIEDKTLSANSWSGTGPWTQNVSVQSTPDNIVIGMASGITAEQAKAYAKAGIHISAVDGSTITVRALYEAPEVDIPVAVLYSTSSVV